MTRNTLAQLRDDGVIAIVALCWVAACSTQVSPATPAAEDTSCDELEAHLVGCGLSPGAFGGTDCEAAGVLLIMGCDELAAAMAESDAKSDGAWYDFNRGYWEPCSFDVQCDETAGLVCQGSLCTHGCSGPENRRGRRCTNPEALCREDGVPSLHTYCLPPRALGEPCFYDDDECATGTFCNYSPSDVGTVCSPPSHEEQVCREDHHCVEGLFCRPMSFPEGSITVEECGSARGEGNYCWKNEHCVEGLICRPTGRHRHVERTCMPPGEQGVPCFRDNQHCAGDDLVCRPNSADRRRWKRDQSCMPLGHEGEICQDDSNCTPGLFCWQLRCRASLQAGERCPEEDDKCGEGLVCRPPPAETGRRDSECLPPL